eukprot:2449245-Amphidinium_carterae.1
MEWMYMLSNRTRTECQAIVKTIGSEMRCFALHCGTALGTAQVNMTTMDHSKFASSSLTSLRSAASCCKRASDYCSKDSKRQQDNPPLNLV